MCFVSGSEPVTQADPQLLLRATCLYIIYDYLPYIPTYQANFQVLTCIYAICSAPVRETDPQLLLRATCILSMITIILYTLYTYLSS